VAGDAAPAEGEAVDGQIDLLTTTELHDRRDLVGARRRDDVRLVHSSANP
jgi:hypothetical protein